MSLGRLIVIEGTDGSGKATQTKKLISRLRNDGIICEKISFPTYKQTPFGDITGDCYLGKNNKVKTGSWFPEGAANVDPLLASVFYAGNRYELKQKITKLINSGVWTILDRYYQSNMAHQGGKISHDKRREELFKKLELLEFKYFGIPREDMTIFLHMPAWKAMEMTNERSKKENLILDGHEKDPDHIRNSELVYIELAERYNWPTVECLDKDRKSKTRKQIHKEVYSFVKELF